MVGAAKDTKLVIIKQEGVGLTDTLVAHVSSISGPNQSRESIDVTALDSTGGYREYIDGFKDGGEVAIQGFFDYADGGQKAVYAAFDGEGVNKFSIIFPERIGAKWVFNGVVTAFEVTSEVGNAVGFSATIKVSGKPVLSALDDEE